MFIRLEYPEQAALVGERQLKVPSRMLKHPTQQRSQLLVLSIREAAVQICSTRPPSDLTIKNVAARAGVSNGSIYQYFFGMEGIVASVYDDFLTAAIERSGDLSVSHRQHIERDLHRLDTMFEKNYGRTFYWPLIQSESRCANLETIFERELMCWRSTEVSPRHYWTALLDTEQRQWDFRRPA